MNTTAKTPEEYISQLEEPRKSEVTMLDKTIREAVPHLRREMDYGIGYGPYHYKYASGREGDAHVISLASQKNYISLYVLATKNDDYLAGQYQAQLPKTSIGKSCIRFKKLEDIDLDVIAKLCKEAAENIPLFDY